MIDLKPCSHCGGQAKLIQTTSGYTSGQPITLTNQYVIECSECGIRTRAYASRIYQRIDGMVCIDKNGAIDAMDVWNRRASEQ